MPLLEFFVPATVICTFFALQRSVLAAAGRAAVVPVENIIFALLTIALLPVAVVWTPQDGVALSWVAATALVVVGTTGYLFVRVLPPAQDVRNAATAARVRLSRVSGGYAGRVLWSAALYGLPLLVLLVLGPVDAAVYGIVWTVTVSLSSRRVWARPSSRRRSQRRPRHPRLDGAWSAGRWQSCCRPSS